MTTGPTPYQQVRQIGFMIARVASATDIDSQSQAARKSFETLRHTIRTAQDVLKDYETFELEEDVRAQARALPKAIKSLEKLREALLKASEYELVGAVDVAQLSAELDGLTVRLR